MRHDQLKARVVVILIYILLGLLEFSNCSLDTRLFPISAVNHAGHLTAVNTPNARRKLASTYSPQNVPEYSNVDSIYVFHLRSFPLLQINTEHGSFSIQTSGLALRSTATDTIVILEYKPINYTICFLPLVDTIPGTSIKTLHWDKRADVFYSSEIDQDYWQHSTYLATINGVVYKNYINWVEQYLNENNRMFPHSICSSTNQSACFIDALSSETFLSDSFSQLASLSVSMHAVIPPRATELRYITETKPVKLFTTQSTDGSHDKPSRKPIPPSNAASYSAGTTNAFIVSSNNRNSISNSNSSRLRQRRQLKLRGSLHIPLHSTPSTTTASSIAPQSSISTTSKPAVTDDEWDDHEWRLYIPEADVIEYYQNIMVCMEGYHLSDFSDALKSCLGISTAYVHAQDNSYYRIVPRFPYATNFEYAQYIPPPEYHFQKHASLADVSIIIIVCAFGAIGLLLAMARMKVMEGCCTGTAVKFRRIVNSKPPPSGGYSPGASELKSRFWGASSWVFTGSNSPSYERLAASPPPCDGNNSSYSCSDNSTTTATTAAATERFAAAAAAVAKAAVAGSAVMKKCTISSNGKVHYCQYLSAADDVHAGLLNNNSSSDDYDIEELHLSKATFSSIDQQLSPMQTFSASTEYTNGTEVVVKKSLYSVTPKVERKEKPKVRRLKSEDTEYTVQQQQQQQQPHQQQQHQQQKQQQQQLVAFTDDAICGSLQLSPPIIDAAAAVEGQLLSLPPTPTTTPISSMANYDSSVHGKVILPPPTDQIYPHQQQQQPTQQQQNQLQQLAQQQQEIRQEHQHRQQHQLQPRSEQQHSLVATNSGRPALSERKSSAAGWFY